MSNLKKFTLPIIKDEIADMRTKFFVKNLKRSMPFIGTMLFGFGFLSVVASWMSNKYIYGSDNTGGSILRIRSILGDDDITYNREFQRMRYLTEPASNFNGKLNEDLVLSDLGYNEQLGKPEKVLKKAPHYKYY